MLLQWAKPKEANPRGGGSWRSTVSQRPEIASETRLGLKNVPPVSKVHFRKVPFLATLEVQFTTGIKAKIHKKYLKLWNFKKLGPDELRQLGHMILNGLRVYFQGI